jgi:hypothetical protein
MRYMFMLWQPHGNTAVPCFFTLATCGAAFFAISCCAVLCLQPPFLPLNGIHFFTYCHMGFRFGAQLCVFLQNPPGYALLCSSALLCRRRVRYGRYSFYITRTRWFSVALSVV